MNSKFFPAVIVTAFDQEREISRTEAMPCISDDTLGVINPQSDVAKTISEPTRRASEMKRIRRAYT